MKLLSFKNFFKLPGVYIIKNMVNNKLYVGESVNIWHRMYMHRNKDRKQVISKAISKYGIENFEVYVEYFPNFNKHELLIIEENLIKNLKCLYPNGYNICSVGQECPSRKGISRPPRTKTWCENLSKGLKGRIISDSTKIKMSKNRLGKRLSPETRMKISLKHKGRKKSIESVKASKQNNPLRKTVIQYDMDGNFITEYMSLYDAERATGAKATNISNTCKGKYKSAKGFKWKFKLI